MCVHTVHPLCNLSVLLQRKQYGKPERGPSILAAAHAIQVRFEAHVRDTAARAAGSDPAVPTNTEPKPPSNPADEIAQLKSKLISQVSDPVNSQPCQQRRVTPDVCVTSDGCVCDRFAGAGV